MTAADDRKTREQREPVPDSSVKRIQAELDAGWSRFSISDYDARAVVAALALAREENERLRGLVYALSDCLTDEGGDWSDDGLQRLRCRAARALPDVEWLQPYLQQHGMVEGREGDVAQAADGHRTAGAKRGEEG